jgi:hypothetical protein
MNAPLYRGTRKALRDLLQAVAAVAAAGGTTALIDVVVDSVNPATGVVLAFVFKVLFAFLMNWAETAGKIPTLLPTPGLVPSVGAVAGKTVGVVETTVDTVGGTVGDLEGIVEDTAGGLLGVVLPADEDEEEE